MDAASARKITMRVRELQQLVNELKTQVNRLSKCKPCVCAEKSESKKEVMDE